MSEEEDVYPLMLFRFALPRAKEADLCKTLATTDAAAQRFLHQARPRARVARQRRLTAGRSTRSSATSCASC